MFYLNKIIISSYSLSVCFHLCIVFIDKLGYKSCWTYLAKQDRIDCLPYSQYKEK